MRCRYLVPTLGLLTCVGSAQAAELGDGLTIGGYVDSIFSFVDSDAADDPSLDFSATALLQTGATIGDSVNLQIDMLIDDSSDLTLVQAYSAWAINEQVNLQFGKAISWIGYQTRYATGLYRINATPYTSELYGNDTVGVWGIISPTEEVTVILAVVDELYGTKSESDSLAFGLDVSVALEGFGSVNIEMGLDPSGADAAAADITEGAVAAEADAAATEIAINATADQVVEDFIFGAEIISVDYDEAMALGGLLMANYTLPTEIPMSATLMFSYYDQVDDDDLAEDDELMEVAVALLTNPTDDANFAINAEINFISAAADDADSVGFFLEALAVIP